MTVKTKSVTTLIGVAVVAVVVILFGGEPDIENGVQTKGKITDLYRGVNRTEDGDITSICRRTATYRVNGTEYTIEDSWGNDQHCQDREYETVDIIYDPEDPSRAYIAD